MSFTRLESFIYEKMAATHLAGVSAAIVRGEDVIWARGFGSRDAEHYQPATPQTLYCVASLTKSFTVTAVMQLVERGLLSLDDPIETHIPEFTLRPGGESIKLWHCMAHMSGIAALAFVEGLIDHATGNADVYLPIGSMSDILLFMDEAEDWVLSKPGESYHYLNEGYVLLGLVIERVSGEPFAEYVTEHILRPLGMARSTFDQATFDADPDPAVPYLHTDDGANLPSVYVYGPNLPDGGLISSVLEMARYIAMRLGRGTFEGVQILRPESVAEMERQRTTTGWQGTDFGEAGYGLGLGLLPDFLGRRVVQHGGSVGTATSHLAYPTRGWA
jgi:CubicO group peptidase (beta-lactamase class C family)